MRYEIRGSAHVRACTISERKVRLPNCFKGLGKYEASPGDFVTLKMHGDDTYDTRMGRVLGRVDAPFVPSSTGDAEYDCPKVEGWLAVLVLGDNARHAYVRWIDPTLVLECTDPPTNLMRWFFQPELPDPATVIKLADYGTLSENYIADPKRGPKDLRGDDRRAFLFDAPDVEKQS